MCVHTRCIWIFVFSCQDKMSPYFVILIRTEAMDVGLQQWSPLKSASYQPPKGNPLSTWGIKIMKGPWAVVLQIVLQIRLYKTWCLYISFSPSDYDNQTGEERNAAPPRRIKKQKGCDEGRYQNPLIVKCGCGWMSDGICPVKTKQKTSCLQGWNSWFQMTNIILTNFTEMIVIIKKYMFTPTRSSIRSPILLAFPVAVPTIMSEAFRLPGRSGRRDPTSIQPP